MTDLSRTLSVTWRVVWHFGGLAMRPYVDRDKVRVSFIQAPVFLPLQNNTQDVSSAAIITKTIKSEGNKQKFYTLIELARMGQG